LVKNIEMYVISEESSGKSVGKDLGSIKFQIKERNFCSWAFRIFGSSFF